MAKFVKCPTCGREYNGFMCFNCSGLPPKTEVKVKDLKEMVWTIEKKNPKPTKKIEGDEIGWVKLYDSSYLHNKLNINSKSIKNETSVIKVWDRYVLHSEIVEKWKEENL